MNTRKSNDDRSPFLASLNTVPGCQQRVADTDWLPAVDVSDTGEEYLFECDLPGLTQEEIHFSQRGDALYVTGVRTTQSRGGSSLRLFDSCCGSSRCRRNFPWRRTGTDSG